ncbi:hypothetical protein PLESTB_001524500 [Pleodorina starrii]|uniref:Glutamine amidotransferase type-2 domain-containing protein n=1 Tax=Pleodorina starrii TaxID=330485 RepID=A0A9W6BWT7_9CHLO|nr:hypothetical protein PLESTM_001169200 [Pleodorina starrii]GLC59702.1 hypothetical protein PLESTB_001524500 [Pleodorina starrii]GLC75375.1 hypothetical protein PLESTF_001629300 [Pleodorina starrii]
MLAAHPGSFFCYVTKTPTFIGSLLGSRANTDQAVNDRLDRYAEASSRRSQTQQLSTSPQTQVQKFVYPGGGVTVQPAVEAITDELVRVTPYVQQSKDTILVFFGALSNLQDLLTRSRSGDSSHEGAGIGALTTACLLDLYRNFDDGRELLMLSELQGQFAFVLYDSSRKQAFAARDPSGAEPLYYKIDEDGGVQYTNALEQLPPGDAEGRSWKELQPGHYMLGKTVAQFALSLRQLETRERKESQDAESLHAMLQRGSHSREEERGGFSVRSLLRNRSK